MHPTQLNLKRRPTENEVKMDKLAFLDEEYTCNLAGTSETY